MFFHRCHQHQKIMSPKSLFIRFSLAFHSLRQKILVCAISASVVSLKLITLVTTRILFIHRLSRESKQSTMLRSSAVSVARRSWARALSAVTKPTAAALAPPTSASTAVSIPVRFHSVTGIKTTFDLPDPAMPPKSQSEGLQLTKIVSTIGPTSEQAEPLLKVTEAGMRIMRLNFSHATPEEVELRTTNLKAAMVCENDRT